MEMLNQALTDATVINTQNMTQIEELKWQLEYEKKLNGQMINMLEHKVSHHLAEIDQLKREASDRANSTAE